MLKTFKLNNGLQVATYNLPGVKSVHIRISAKGGSLVEDKKSNGLGHYMEHLLVQGIPSYTNVEEFAGHIEGLAGSYSAYTESMLIGFSITVPFIHLEDALNITSEVAFQPLFSADAIERERGVLVDEIKQKMDSHYYKISQFFRISVFKPHSPLTLEIGGTVDALNKITRKEIMDFWKTYFVPENTYLLLTGDFSTTKLPEILSKYFEKVGNHHGFPGFPKMSQDDFLPRGVKIRFDQSLKTNYLDFIIPSLQLQDPLTDRIKQNLCLIILGQLRNSRLFKLLRYQKGLVYNVRAGSAKYPGLGYVYISSEVPAENLTEVVRLITKELMDFIADGPSQEELEFAKNFLTSQWLMAFDHPSSIANWVESDLLWEKEVTLPEQSAKLIKDIKTTDVLEVMQKYWDFSKLNLVIQGPVKETPNNLKKFAEIIKELKNG